MERSAATGVAREEANQRLHVVSGDIGDVLSRERGQNLVVEQGAEARGETRPRPRCSKGARWQSNGSIRERAGDSLHPRVRWYCSRHPDTESTRRGAFGCCPTNREHRRSFRRFRRSGGLHPDGAGGAVRGSRQASHRRDRSSRVLRSPAGNDLRSPAPALWPKVPRPDSHRGAFGHVARFRRSHRRIRRPRTRTRLAWHRAGRPGGRPPDRSVRHVRGASSGTGDHSQSRVRRIPLMRLYRLNGVPSRAP